MRAFEYGSGQSSLWYAQRLAAIVSVDHDPYWAEMLRKEAPSNCQIVLAPDDDEYIYAIANFPLFDIVVIDGQHRPKTAIAAIDGLKSDGIMIWDNSDWAEFAETFPALQSLGFRRIAFAGMGPINRYGWETSILYRTTNCLGI